MWGKIIIPMYRLWLNGLYGLYGPRCPLSSKRPINLISLSLSLSSSYRHSLGCFTTPGKNYKWFFTVSHFGGEKQHFVFSGLVCVRNQMTAPHHQCGAVIWFLTHDLSPLTYYWILNLTKTLLGSSPRVVKHLRDVHNVSLWCVVCTISHLDGDSMLLVVIWWSLPLTEDSRRERSDT